MEKSLLFVLTNIGSLLLFAGGVPAMAAEIKVLSGNGARGAIVELAARFERASGHKVNLEFHVNPEVKQKIEAGEVFDVAILNPPVLDDLIKQGKVLVETRGVIGRSGIGVGIRESAAKPDAARLKSERGVAAMDVAKRLLDFGFHAPTVYFPLIVRESIMIEPTETESKETMDAFIAVMIEAAQTAENDPEALHQAPLTMPISRLDETKAAREQNVCFG